MLPYPFILSILISFHAGQGMLFLATSVGVRLRYCWSCRRGEWRRRLVVLMVGYTTRGHASPPILLISHPSSSVLGSDLASPSEVGVRAAISGPGDWRRRLVVRRWVVGYRFSDLVIGRLLCPTRESSYPDSPAGAGAAFISLPRGRGMAFLCGLDVGARDDVAALRRWRRNDGGDDRWNDETTRSTCAGGGTALTSLREGRRNSAACLRRLQATAITANGPQTCR